MYKQSMCLAQGLICNLISISFARIEEKSLFFDITFWIADELSKLSSNNICLWNFMLNLACACWISGGGEGSYSYKYELCSQIDDESNGI